MFLLPVRSALARCCLPVFFLGLPLASAQATEARFAVTPAQMQALGVQLMTLNAPAPLAGMNYPARVVLPPQQEVLLSAPLAGLVEQLLVSVNDSVRPGQPLLRLVSPELGELQLRLLEAAAKVRLTQAQVQRERQLLAEGLIPERRLLEAESALAQDQARQAQAEAALRLAGLDAASIARVAAGGALQDGLTLSARRAGVVTELLLKPGQRVQQGDALVRMVDTRRLWLEIQIPVDRRDQVLTRNGAVRVVDREVQARPLGLGSVVSDSQTLSLRAEVTQGAALLRPGEFVQVQVPFSSATEGGEGWTVPLAAIARQGEQAYVFVREPQGFTAVAVSVLASAGTKARVQGALQAGQQLAVSSVIALKAAWLGKGGGE